MVQGDEFFDFTYGKDANANYAYVILTCIKRIIMLVIQHIIIFT